MDAHDTYLVLTFSGETRVLGMNAGARRGDAGAGQSTTLWGHGCWA